MPRIRLVDHLVVTDPGIMNNKDVFKASKNPKPKI